MVLSSQHYFVDCFKFQSQHFFKVVSLLNGKPEIKGKKAHHLFSHFIGCRNYDEATIYLKRLAGHSDRSKFSINVDRAAVLNILGGLSIQPNQVDLLLEHFYRVNSGWQGDKKARATLLKSLKHVKSISHIPHTKYVDVDDDLAHDLFRLGETMSGEHWNTLYRDQLVGVLKILRALFRADLLTHYSFQDVVDCMELAHYELLNTYFTHLYENWQWTEGPGLLDLHVINHCFGKVMRYFEQSSAKKAHIRYQRQLSEILRRDVPSVEGRVTLTDCLALRTMELAGENLWIPTSHHQRLSSLGVLTEPKVLSSWGDKITTAGRDLTRIRFN